MAIFVRQTTDNMVHISFIEVMPFINALAVLYDKKICICMISHAMKVNFLHTVSDLICRHATIDLMQLVTVIQEWTNG